MIDKKLVASSPESKKPIALLVGLKLIHLCVNIVVVSSLVNALVHQTVKPLTSIVFLVSFILKVILPYFQTKLNHTISKQVSSTLRTRILTTMFENPEAKHQLTDSEWAQLTTEGIEHIEVYFSQYIPQFFYSMMAPVILVVVLGRIHLGIAIALFIGVPLIPISIIAVQKFAKKLLSKYWDKYTGLGNSFLDNLESLTTLKVFNIDEKAQEVMDKEAEEFRKVTMRVLIMQLNSISVMDLVAYCGSMIAIGLSLLSYKNGGMGLYGVLMFILLSSEFFIPMRQLGSYFHVAMNGQAASDLLDKALSLKDETKEHSTSVDENLGFEVNNLHVTIGQTEILKSISLSLRRGESVGLVGPSGAGKSMLIQSLLGRVTICSGEVLFGGELILNQNIFNHVALVSAKPHLFKASVRDNLEMGYRYSDESMKEILSLLNLDDIKLDDMILERGENLSGGQRQRLELARALLKDTSYYIFDEATANIDMESEAIINGIIDTLKQEGKGILYVSHRLKNVESMDTIMVMDKGHCVEFGNHQNLLSNEGLYYDMYREQSALENFEYMEEQA